MAEPFSSINFQLPVWMRREIEQCAKLNQRSMGREVLFRLTQSLEAEHKSRRTSKRGRKSAGAAPTVREQAQP